MSRCYSVNVRFAFVDCCALLHGQMKCSEGKPFVQPFDIASDSPQGKTVYPFVCLFTTRNCWHVHVSKSLICL
jgi:hypothetical protein